jgi:hypothetical protein
MTEPDLFEKMKSMSKAELEDHYDISIIAGRVLNIAGITAILLALIFSNVFVIGLAAFSTYILGQLAVGIDETKAYIIGLIEQKHKINS